MSVSDIRCFTGSRAVRDLMLPADGGSWTVLAGRNGSGKSSLLRALALALGGPQVARGLVRDFSGWITSGAESGWAEAYVQPDYAYDGLTGSGGRSPAGPQALGLDWSLPEGGAGETRRVGRGGAPPQPELAPYGWSDAARGPWAAAPQGWFCAGYGPFRRLVGGSGEAQRMMLAPGPGGRMASLFHEDASLAEGVSWLVELRMRSLEEQEGAAELLSTVQDLLSDGLLPDGHRVERVTSDGLWISAQADGQRAYPLREMSDGFRAVAALVLDIVRQLQSAYGTLDAATDDEGGPLVRVPGVVIIDEIDAHLHVTWQRRIGHWLRRHFPRLQFIVTSHSPYICQAADEGGLIRLPGPHEDRPPEVVSEDLYHRIVYGSGDDAALSELFGLESTFSRQAERDRRRLVELEGKVYAGQASEQEALEYQELDERLTSSLRTRAMEVAARLGGGR